MRPPATVPARLHRTIRPPAGWAALGLGEIGAFRDLLFTLAARDVKLRYRQTALGVLWVVLQPLIAAGIITFVFGRIANLKAPGGEPYFVFAFAGQIAWTAFATTLSKTSTSLVGNSALVSKIFFPRLVLPLSTLLTTLVDFGVGLVMLLILMAVNRVPLFYGFVLMPFYFLLIALLGLAVGLFAAALMVRYRDIGLILPVATQFLFFASPVAYPLADFTARFGSVKSAAYLLLNPIAPLLEVFRWSLFGQTNLPKEYRVPWAYVAYAAGATLALLYLGAMVFRQQERRFADVI